jgi:phycocyanobilin:ferredoxin oxidoreductase
LKTLFLLENRAIAMTATTSSSSSSLRHQQHRLIRKLADAIESAWQNYFDLSLYQLPEGLGYIEGRLEGERLTIENSCYQSKHFRKMHLELAKVGSNLDILHCVMFPRPEYALPMFGCDLVGGRGQISAAIVDLSPTNAERILPQSYQTVLSVGASLSFSQPRDLPEWGDIFSPFCLFIRPGNEEEEELFLARVNEFLALHCSQALASQMLSSEEREIYLAGQHYYCNKQRQNDKTRRVLEKAFGEEWAENYMTQVLFDL